MTFVDQNILSGVMLKNDKLFNANIRLHLATPGKKLIEQSYEDIDRGMKNFWTDWYALTILISESIASNKFLLCLILNKF